MGMSGADYRIIVFPAICSVGSHKLCRARGGSVNPIMTATDAATLPARQKWTRSCRNRNSRCSREGTIPKILGIRKVYCYTRFRLELAEEKNESTNIQVRCPTIIYRISGVAARNEKDKKTTKEV